jgi:hypothetical protein
MNSYCGKVVFNKQEYAVEVWDGKTEPYIEQVVGLDTETEPFIAGVPYKPVLLQVFWPENKVVTLVRYPYMELYLALLRKFNPRAKLVFHNIAFDYWVLGGIANPVLTEAVTRGLCVDIGLRYLLKRMADGTWVGKITPKWALDVLVKEFIGVELSKDEELRLSFRQDKELTPEQVTYAALDSVATIGVYNRIAVEQPTEQIQIIGSIALQKISLNGLKVDPIRFNDLKKNIQKQKDECEYVLNVFGYFSKQKGNEGVLQDVLHNIEERVGLVFPRTKKGYEKDRISVTNELINLFPDNKHPFLTAYKEFKHLEKLLSTYLNDKFLAIDSRVHPRFSPILVTGRTSASCPPVQQLPRREGLRGQYRAEEGCVLYAADYSQLELCALAETCYKTQGFSTMRDLIVAGTDLHSWFAGKIKEKAKTSSESVDWRQLSKAANFGPKLYYFVA